MKGETEMRSLRPHHLAAFALLTLLSLVSATPAKAQAYLHAISDLRTARAYLQMNASPQSANARTGAINEINHALEDMEKAVRDDGKNPWHTPPPQSDGNLSAPLHSAARLLKKARTDLEGGGPEPSSGLRDRSYRHIDNALQQLSPFL
jgi:hypothetical protein